MRFEVIYEGPMSELSYPSSQAHCVSGERSLRGEPLRWNRRQLLQLFGATLPLLATPFCPLGSRVRAQSSGLISSHILNHSVVNISLPVHSTQEAMTELNNATTRRQDGVLIADFKTNGIITDQGTELVSVPAGGFVIGRFIGDTGGLPGRGSSTGYTSLGSRSATYQVTR